MISVVIPVYNELELLDELRLRTVASMETTGQDFEVIFVDDGSTDGSLERLIGYHRSDARLKVLELSRNFGHQSAISAGLAEAAGAYVAIMDGDLQDPPELIPVLLGKMKAEDLDVVNAERATRGERLFRKLLANLFHYIFSRFSDIRARGSFGNFCLLNRQAANALLSFREESRYLPGLRSYMGFRQGRVSYNRDPRRAGRTKMRAGSLLRLASDAFFSFSRWPLKFCLFLGAIGTVFWLIAGLVAMAQPGSLTLFGDSRLIGIGLFLLGSIQLLFIGVLGEYLHRAYRQSLRRPLYFIRNRYADA